MTAALDRLLAIGEDEPGVAAAAIVGGRVVWMRCAGLADTAHRVPIRPTTRFHLVSCSKPFTAATALAAVAAGKLALDDDIRRHLPEMTPPDHGRPVLVRHLLSMTSGLDDVLEIARLGGVWHPSPSRPADLLALALRRSRTSAPPGGRFMYCNGNFVLLDEILRRIDGRSADAARRQAVYGPLGLGGATDRPHDGLILPDLAVPHVDAEGGWQRPTDIVGICGDRVVASLEDMVGWIMSLREGRIGDLATTAEMSRRSRLADGRELHYGLGFFVRGWRGLRALGHFGTQPGYKAGFVLLPERDVAVVMLANREDVHPGRLVPQMLATLLPDTAEGRVDAGAVPTGEFADPETGEWARLTAGEDGATVELLGFSARLVPDGDGWRDDGGLGALMPVRVSRAPGGGVDVDIGGAAARLAPVPDAAGISSADDCAGSYDGIGMPTRHVIRRGPAGLEIAYGPAGDSARVFPMRPIGRDLFLVEPTAPGIAHRHVFRFHRDARGTVCRAAVTMERLKGVPLERCG
ncbi:MAG: serine hydrolase domain-containing protein [Alphaproteobacteria bacterium]